MEDYNLILKPELKEQLLKSWLVNEKMVEGYIATFLQQPLEHIDISNWEMVELHASNTRTYTYKPLGLAVAQVNYTDLNNLKAVKLYTQTLPELEHG